MALIALLWFALSCAVAMLLSRAYADSSSTGRYRVTPLPRVHRYTAAPAPTPRPAPEPETLRPRNRAEARKAEAIARRAARRGHLVHVEPRR